MPEPLAPGGAVGILGGVGPGDRDAARPLPPGSAVGILGGGQLGRMLARAAARLGLIPHIYDPDPEAPAGQVARLTAGAWDDRARLAAFARAVDVVTCEFENVPLPALETVGALRPLRPGAQAFAVAADRLAEKRFLAGLGLATAPFAAVDAPDDLGPALAQTGTPALLKTRRLGYDGKGQRRIDAPAAAAAAFAAIGAVPAVLEGIVAFDREISVIAARGLDGTVVAYDPGENLHEGGILRRTRAPARLAPGRAAEAVRAAARIVAALDYAGVIGVEFFDTEAGLVVNEIAPRVHNSGHWTEAGCLIDQFEQHIRAIAGWPLGDGRRHSDVEMTNLLGAEVAQALDLAAAPDVQVHLYGKREARPGRKMGHVNRRLGPAGA